MKIVCLASGGIDSSLLMLVLKERGYQILPLFINYGQLAWKREWQSCKQVCNYLGLSPTIFDINKFGILIPSGITNSKLDVVSDAFLPCRNLLLLVIGASFAYSNGSDLLAIGILSNPIFPDQKMEFLQISEKAVHAALGKRIKIITPFIELDKLDILKLAKKHAFPIQLTYSCHIGGERRCGYCISCRDLVLAERHLDE